MTAVTVKIERSGPAIRAALTRFAPRECPMFEAELGKALTYAAQSLDLSSAQAVLDRWWAVAVVRANPLSDGEREQLARVREDEVSGLSARDEHGNWVRL